MLDWVALGFFLLVVELNVAVLAISWKLPSGACLRMTRTIEAAGVQPERSPPPSNSNSLTSTRTTLSALVREPICKNPCNRDAVDDDAFALDAAAVADLRQIVGAVGV